MGVKFDVTKLGKTTLFDPQEMGYRDSLDIIKDESVKIQKSFVKIGWYLKHIRDNELYLEDGYADINECAAAQLGYSQSSVSRFINICEKFSKDHNSPELDEKYSGFDKSQMFEMLPLEPEQLEKVTPDMTVKKIREIKKKDSKAKRKEADEEEEADLPGQTSLEEDFPEYLPDLIEPDTSDQQDDKTEYVTSHKDQDQDEGEPEEEVVIESTCREIQEQPDLPTLKNNDQRKEWLTNYKAWGLWYRDENIDVNYYKYDFSDGSRLVVAEYPQRFAYWNREMNDEYYYHLLEKNKKGYKHTYDEAYRHKEDNMTYLVEFLKNLQKG